MDRLRAPIGEDRILEFETDFLLAEGRSADRGITAYSCVVIPKRCCRGRHNDWAHPIVKCMRRAGDFEKTISKPFGWACC